MSQTIRVAVQGAEIHVEDTGRADAMPILVIHGGLGFDSTYFHPYLDALGRSNRVLFVDLRGHGQSTGEESLERATHATFVDDLRTVIADLQLAPVTVLGHSYGGVIALEYALAHSEDLSGMILCDTPGSFAHVPMAIERVSQRATPQMVEAISEAFAGPPADEKSSRRVWERLVPLYFKDRALARAPFARMRYSVGGIRALFRLMPTFDLRSRLVDIRTPALVLAGVHDWLQPSDDVATRLPNAERHTFARSGHFPFVEEPDEFVRVVSAWLAKTQRRGARSPRALP